jgi:glycosyltransferase involved in cell wall biosynthesis
VTAPRIAILTGNNVLIDARALRYIQAAGELGYDAIGIGIQPTGPDTEEHTVPGGRVIIKRTPNRMSGRGATQRRHAWFNALAPFAWKADPGTVRALAAHLRRDSASGLGNPPSRLVRRVYSSWLSLAARLRQTGSTRRAGGGEPQSPFLEDGAITPTERRRRRALAWYRAFPLAARWRTVVPDRIASEIALAPLLDQLQPDIIHVHDVFQLGVGAWARARAAQAGRACALVYDAREDVSGLAVTAPRTVAALANLEREFIGYYPRIVTVSESLADLLVRRYHLRRRPDLVLNAPVAGPKRPDSPDIRLAAGLPDGVPLMVYGGGVNATRGIQTAIRALPLVPELHLAVVIRDTRWMPAALTGLAQSLGVSDRFHAVPFVEHDQVVNYLASADIGISPLLHAPNHDVALTNKFCEYLVAGLPIITSDTPEQARLVDDLGIGAVYPAGDPATLAAAARQVLDNLPDLKRRIAEDTALRQRFSWPAQQSVLERVWRESLGGS